MRQFQARHLVRLVCSLALLLLTGETRAVDTPSPLLIAHVAPKTGRFALHSESDWRGVQMAVDEANATGGVLGRQIVLVSSDPTMDPVRAAEVAESLISQSKVGFMIGAISSDVAAGVSVVAQRHGVVFLNTNSSSPSESVENVHRTKFVFDANAANYNRTLLRYALNRHSSKRVTLLTEDDQWGHSSAKASAAIIAENGGQVVAEVLVPANLPDPAETVRRIDAIGSDVVAVNISGNNQIKLFAVVPPELLSGRSWVVGEVDWEELYPAPGTPRPLFGMTWAWTFQTPGTADFVGRYRQRYGNTTLPYPGHITHSAYLATKALLQAISRAGSTHTRAVVEQLEQYRASAAERMQDDDAVMNPISHHLQQSTYVVTWHPQMAHPENGVEVLGRVSPADNAYDKESSAVLEPWSQTPDYAP